MPKNADANSLFRTGSPSCGAIRGIDLDPAAARFEREQRRNLVEERRGGRLVRFPERDRRVDDWEACPAHLAEQALNRHDDGVEIAHERRLGVGETAVDVDHDQGGPLPEAGPAVESRRASRSASVLYAGAGIPSPSLTRASASSPGSSGDHRSGTAGTGGSRPVSSLQLASNCSRGGP